MLRPKAAPIGWLEAQKQLKQRGNHADMTARETMSANFVMPPVIKKNNMQNDLCQGLEAATEQ